MNKQEKVLIAVCKQSMNLSPYEQSLKTPSSVHLHGDQDNQSKSDE